MLDALGALGLAANIVQFIDFTGRLLSKGKEIHASIEGTSVANLELEAVASHVEKLARDIEASLYRRKKKDPPKPIPKSIENDEAKVSTQEELDEIELRRLCEKCIREAQQLLQALQKLKVKKTRRSRKWESFRAALSSIWTEEEIEGLTRQLNTTRQLIDSRILVAIKRNIEVSNRGQSTLLDGVTGVDQAVRELNKTITSHITADKKWKAAVVNSLLRNVEGSINSEELAVSFAKAAETSREDQITKNIIDRLHFRQMTGREEMVALAHRETFGWIYSREERHKHQWADFVDWLTGEQSLYWITGKAGSGKSTLMKFLLNDRRTTSYLEQNVDNFPLVIAGFFFWNSGTTMQMSIEGLLRTLLSIKQPAKPGA